MSSNYNTSYNITTIDWNVFLTSINCGNDNLKTVIDDIINNVDFTSSNWDMIIYKGYTTDNVYLFAVPKTTAKKEMCYCGYHNGSTNYTTLLYSFGSPYAKYLKIKTADCSSSSIDLTSSTAYINFLNLINNDVYVAASDTVAEFTDGGSSISDLPWYSSELYNNNVGTTIVDDISITLNDNWFYYASFPFVFNYELNQGDPYYNNYFFKNIFINSNWTYTFGDTLPSYYDMYNRSSTTLIYTQNFPDSSGLVLNIYKTEGIDSQTGSNYKTLEYRVANPTGSQIIVNDIYYLINSLYSTSGSENYHVAHAIELAAGEDYSLTSYYAIESDSFYQELTSMIYDVENNLATIVIYPNDIADSRTVTGTVPALAGTYDSFDISLRIFAPYIDDVDTKSCLVNFTVPALTLNGEPISDTQLNPQRKFVMSDSSDNKLNLAYIDYVYSNGSSFVKCIASGATEASILSNWDTNTITFEEYVPGGTIISDELIGSAINLDEKFSAELHYRVQTPWDGMESYGNLETILWVLNSRDGNEYYLKNPMYSLQPIPNDTTLNNICGISFVYQKTYPVSSFDLPLLSVWVNDSGDPDHEWLYQMREYIANLKANGFTVDAQLYYDNESRVETFNTPNVTEQVTSTFTMWECKSPNYQNSLVVLNEDSIDYWENLDPIATLYMYDSTHTNKSPVYIKYGTNPLETRIENINNAEIFADWETNPLGFENGEPSPGPTPPGPTPSGNLAEYLEALVRDRNTLVSNLNTMGVSASTAETFTELVPKVLEIPQPSGTLNITSNDTYDVTDYAEAVVNVPGGITPTGSITLSQNDTYDVTQYAEAVVNVPGPSGTISITQNGNAIDVSQYQYANVSVSGGGGNYNAYMITSTSELENLPAVDGDYAMLPSIYSMPLDAKVFGGNKYTVIYDMNFAPNLMADLTQYNTQISLTDLFAEIGQSWASQIMQIQYSPDFGSGYTLTFTINSSTTVSYTSQDGINWTTSDAVPVQFQNGVIASGNDWSGANAQFLADLFNKSTSISVMQHNSLVWESREDSGSIVWELLM